jgi:hypothetical protein
MSAADVLPQRGLKMTGSLRNEHEALSEDATTGQLGLSRWKWVHEGLDGKKMAEQPVLSRTM